MRPIAVRTASANKAEHCVRPVGASPVKVCIYLAAVVLSSIATFFIGKDYLRGQYINAAVPFFFLLMLVEFVVGWGATPAAGQYNLADSICSITSGMMQQLAYTFYFRFFTFSLYQWVQKASPLPLFPMNSTVEWILSFLAVDFGYYWFHRLAHEVNIAWASHSTHHSSDRYNLTTALRQSMFQGLFSQLVYMPLALVFPYEFFAFQGQLNTLFQFWVHTTTVRRLGILEWLVCTPSHHRVHHDRRVHKNYGGVLIIWDRLFGSFMDEGEGFRPGKGFFYSYAGILTESEAKGDENVVYGVLRDIDSIDPIWVQINLFWSIWQRILLAPTWGQRARTFFVGPGYRPAMARRKSLPDPSTATRLRGVINSTWAALVYHWLNFATINVGALLLLLFSKRLNDRVYLALLFSVIFSSWCQASMLRNMPHMVTIELWRQIAVFGSCVALLASGNITGPIFPIFTCIEMGLSALSIVLLFLISSAKRRSLKSA